MARSFVQWKSSDALIRRFRELSTLNDSRKMDRLRQDIKQIVIEDNVDKILGRGTVGVDRYGKPLARLRGGRPLTAAEYRARGGTGPVLAPRGMGSRVITGFQVRWVREGDTWVLVAGWRNVNSRKGKPFMQYHLKGAPKAHLPRRDVGGVTPKGWKRIDGRLHRFWELATRP